MGCPMKTGQFSKIVFKFISYFPHYQVKKLPPLHGWEIAKPSRPAAAPGL